MKIQSPYTEIEGMTTYRGTWHVHLHSPYISPAQAVAVCMDGGYDFLGVADHDNRFTTLPWVDKDWEKAAQDGFVILKGFEASHPTGHICCLGALPEETGVNAETARKNRYDKAGLDAGYGGFLKNASQCGAFLTLNHPIQWAESAGKLMETPGFNMIHAIEIYNGDQLGKAIERGYNSRLVDDCLTLGSKLWIAACPDCHVWDKEKADSPFNGYSIVYADKPTSGAIQSSLKAGRFYATNGLEIDDIKVTPEYIEIASGQAVKIVFIGRGGAILSESEGGNGKYCFKGDEGYVRAEVISDKMLKQIEEDFPIMAWLQPILIGSEDGC